MISDFEKGLEINLGNDKLDVKTPNQAIYSAIPKD